MKNIPMFMLGRTAGTVGITCGSENESFRKGAWSRVLADTALDMWLNLDADHLMRWAVQVERLSTNELARALQIVSARTMGHPPAEVEVKGPNWSGRRIDSGGTAYVVSRLIGDKQLLATLAAALTEVSING